MQHLVQFENYYKTHNKSEDSYYEEYAQQRIDGGRSRRWNWAAAFFGSYWLLYRKAYRAFFMVMLVRFLPLCLLAVGLGLGVMGFSLNMGGLAQVMFAYKAVAFLGTGVTLLLIDFFFSGWLKFFLFGLFGNKLYFWDIKKRMAQNSLATGTSVIPVLIYASLTLLLLATISGFISSPKELLKFIRAF